MTALVRDAIAGFNWFVLLYFLALNSILLGLVILGAIEAQRLRRRRRFAGHEDVFAHLLTPGVSILIPAFNEEPGIVDSVRGALALRHPRIEIVVIDDGSTDRTFERLQDEFDLVETDRFPTGDAPTIGAIRSVHAARTGEPLVVVRKANAGRCADAINAGLNIAREPLVCMVDADSVLDERALQHAVKPFLDDPARVVATGGVVRPANGCRIERGRLVEAHMPRRWIERVQVVEYLRAFLVGRAGWSRLGGVLIISGAFGLFRRDVLLELGGLDLDCIGQDAEVVVRLHRRLRSQGRRDYRVVFVSEPVCWTEVPHDRSTLARQRTRWARGLAQVLRLHRRMLGNPRYGRIGLVVLPYYLLFELLSPVVELAGIAVVGAGLALGVLDAYFAALLALTALGYGILVSAASLCVEEFSAHRYVSWVDIVVAMLAAVLENLGYRQLHAWWRLRGLLQELRGGEASWGAMRRAGFEPAPADTR